MNLKKHSRRKFLQLTATGVGLSLVYLWDKMMENRLLSTARNKIVLPLTNKVVSFYRDFLMINQKQHIKVLSSHCTHLGCIINKVENGRLICPCHGGNPFATDRKEAHKNMVLIPGNLNNAAESCGTTGLSSQYYTAYQYQPHGHPQRND